MSKVVLVAVGEANSGRAAKGVATYTSGISQAQESASSAMSEIGQAKRVSILSSIPVSLCIFVHIYFVHLPSCNAVMLLVWQRFRGILRIL